MDDDDGPPMLVSADGNQDQVEESLNADMSDARVTKVPITIITGTRHLLDKSPAV